MHCIAMTQASAPTDLHAPTVLVVEDEALVRMPIAEYLRDCGYKVLEAEDAGEAIHMVDGGDPVDVVFSDVRMPGDMDGFDLARWIGDHHPDVPGPADLRLQRAARRGFQSREADRKACTPRLRCWTGSGR